MRYFKNILAAAFLAAAGGGVTLHAQDCITILPNNGDDRVQYKIEDVAKITFDGDNMTVEHSQGVLTMPVDDIDSMRFDIELSPDSELKTALSDDINIDAHDRMLRIYSSKGETIRVTVYDLRGQLVEDLSAPDCVVDFNAKSQGIYIVKANNKVIKYRN